MKQFFASMLGSLAALVIFSLSGAVIFFGLLGIVVAIGGEGATPPVERGSYLVIDLSTEFSDAPPGLDLGVLSVERKAVQLRRASRAIRAAATDERIAGIFLQGGVVPVDGGGYAALREVREALKAFRASGKPMQAYLTNAGTRDYYLASISTDIALDPFGMLLMPGLASEPIFFAGALDKFGVGVQVTRVGKFKSAIEPFTREDMSPESREQLQKLLDDVWSSLRTDMAQSRRIAPEALQAVVDAEGVIRPETAKEAKLVDRTAYLDEIIADLKGKTGSAASSKHTFKQIRLSDYSKIVPERQGASEVAIVYAEGDIVDGDGTRGSVGGARFARELRKLRNDDNVKAIVLRVNSPGGSATASEAIAREVRLARDVKPVVVSMGSYAASGGYWIATHGHRIFAEPTTITGSIGVFGMQVDIQELAGKLGVTFDRVKTGKFSDAITISRPKTEEELAVFQKLVDWIYGEFIGRVAEGRSLSRARVEEIAEGRVWSGTEAVALGLVDEIGGFPAVIADAAKRANLQAGEYRLREFPREMSLQELVGEFLGNPEGAGAPTTGPVGEITRRLRAELRAIENFNSPSGLYARLPFNLVVR